jgi:hypothetical protein
MSTCRGALGSAGGPRVSAAHICERGERDLHVAVGYGLWLAYNSTRLNTCISQQTKKPLPHVWSSSVTVPLAPGSLQSLPLLSNSERVMVFESCSSVDIELQAHTSEAS